MVVNVISAAEQEYKNWGPKISKAYLVFIGLSSEDILIKLAFRKKSSGSH